MSRRHALLRALVALGILVAAARVHAQETLPYRDSTLSVDARVHDLLARMTLEEKFWQLFMIPGDLDDSTHDYSHGVFGLQIDTKPASDPAAADAGINRRAPLSDASAAERSAADRRAADAAR